MTAAVDRAQEIAEFLGIPTEQAIHRLQLGFGFNHQAVNDDWRRANPRTDEQILDWYRTTEAYIWELSAYHIDPGFNYAGQMLGIGEALEAKGVHSVLCLGDGIGDLTMHLRRRNFGAVYHDLADSRTCEFARFRHGKHHVPFEYFTTAGWEPDFGEGEFDAVVSLDFLEHVTDVPAWVEAIQRTLKPGGYLCAQNAFNCGSGPNGSIPCHLERNDRFEKDWDPMLAQMQFVQESSNWYRKAA